MVATHKAVLLVAFLVYIFSPVAHGDDDTKASDFCYSILYNWQDAKGPSRKILNPMTHFPAGHPAIGLDGIVADSTGKYPIPATGPLPDDPTITDYGANVAYAYNVPDGSSSNIGFEEDSAEVLYFIRDAGGSVSFVATHDAANTATGGSVNFSINTGSGASSLGSRNPFISLMDDVVASSTDPDACDGVMEDCYSWGQDSDGVTRGIVGHAWADCCTDGIVLSWDDTTTTWSFSIQYNQISSGTFTKMLLGSQLDDGSVEFIDVGTSELRAGGSIAVLGQTCSLFCSEMETSCECSSASECGWCGSTNTCIPVSAESDCPSDWDDSCVCSTCSAHADPDTCVDEADASCGWCFSSGTCVTLDAYDDPCESCEELQSSSPAEMCPGSLDEFGDATTTGPVDQVCSGNGSCDFNVDKTCECADGFYGDGCEFECPKDAGEAVCSGNGFCGTATAGLCACECGFSGDTCETATGCVATSSQCLIGDSCSEVCGLVLSSGAVTGFEAEGECVCIEGWYGSACQDSCPGVDSSSGEGTPCDGNGTCDSLTGACTCEACFEVDASEGTCGALECSGECDFNGVCVCGTCQCLGARSGDTCEDCDCMNGGVCHPVTGECSCADGFVPGDSGLCEASCSGEDLCSSNGTPDCVTEICTCDAGWVGPASGTSQCSIECDDAIDCSGAGVCNNSGICECTNALEVNGPCGSDCGGNYDFCRVCGGDNRSCCDDHGVMGSDGVCVCDAGFKVFDGSCTACERNTYKGTADSATTCTACADGYSTFGITAATSETSCGTCDAGSYDSGATCTVCPTDTYKATSGVEECTSCAGDRTTDGKQGSTDASACGCSEGFTFTTSCTECTVGTFKDFHGDDSCTTCREGSTVGSTGAISGTSCVCEPGYFQDEDYPSDCSMCGVGTWKSTTENSVCTACGTGLTSPAGSDAVSDCVPAAGFFINTDGDAEACPLHHYRVETSIATECTACPNGKSTESTGSATLDLCQCVAGEYLPSGGDCTVCPEGEFQASFGSPDNCEGCPDNSHTLSSGSDESGDCVCNPGFFRDTDTAICVVCSGESFKAGLGDDEGDCLLCGSNLEISNRNVAGGATSEANCFAPNGYEYNTSTNDGDACAVNYFREGGLTREDGCEACSNSRLTASTGSDSEDLCLCGAGLKLASESCTDCGAGFFSSGLSATCSSCPTNSSTSSSTSTSETECICSPGYTRDTDGDCVACEADTFKASLRDESCEACGIGLSSAEGSSSSEDCLAPAGSIVGRDGNVEVCGVDTYRSGDAHASTCVSCPGDRSTFGKAGSTVETDCLCDVGQKLSTTDPSSCISCEEDTFRDSRGLETSCETCPAGSTTDGEVSSTSSDYCKCPASTEWEGAVAGSSCVGCGDEFFSTGWGDESCTACPSNSSHDATATACECSPGYTVDADDTSFSCVECGVDTFKEVQGNSICEVCGSSSSSGSTTDGKLGSVSSTSCQCPAGYEASETGSPCEICSTGLTKALWGDSSVCEATTPGSVPTDDHTGEIVCGNGFYAPLTSNLEDGQTLECTSCPGNTSSDIGSTIEGCYECPGLSTVNANGLCECPAGAGGPSCVACMIFDLEANVSATLTTHTSESSEFSGSEADLSFPECESCDLTNSGSLDGITCQETDCAGTPGGTLILDSCGFCGGDGSSCEDSSSSERGSFSDVADPGTTTGTISYSTAGAVIIGGLAVLGYLRAHKMKATSAAGGGNNQVEMNDVELGEGLETSSSQVALNDIGGADTSAPPTDASDMDSFDNSGSMASTMGANSW